MSEPTGIEAEVCADVGHYDVYADASMVDRRGACAFRVVRDRVVVTEGAFIRDGSCSLELEIFAATEGLRNTPIASVVILHSDVENMLILIDRPHRISYASKVIGGLSKLRKEVAARIVGVRCNKGGHHGWCHNAARKLIVEQDEKRGGGA